MAYERLAHGAKKYELCHYGSSKLAFRGPCREPEGDYWAVLGGCEIFGRFCERSLADSLEMQMRLPVLNLGSMNAGIEAFARDESVGEICAKAAHVVLHVGGAQGLSNRFYKVHPRRNDRFILESDELRTLFPEADFTRYHFTGHLLCALESISKTRFALVRKSLQKQWIAQMRRFLKPLGGKVTLLWMARMAPPQKAGDAEGNEPKFITRKMLDALDDLVRGRIEIVAGPDEIEAGHRRMRFQPHEAPAALEMLGPVVHEEAAREIAWQLAPA